MIRGDAQADRVVPPSGFTAQLTFFVAGAMAFLAVFALSLSLSVGRLADRWGAELAQALTLRIVAPVDQRLAQTDVALSVLNTTPGVASARALSAAEQQALLSPWFGTEVMLEDLPIPQLIEITEEAQGIDLVGLRLRLSAEVPGAILDDHGRWRAPLMQAATRLRLFSWTCLLLIAATMAAMVMLAAQAALSANAQVIAVLRLVGATDDYIARAFVRRFGLRAFFGASLGTGLGAAALLLLPVSGRTTDMLGDFGFRGVDWVLPFGIPILAAVVAFIATDRAAERKLKDLT